MNILFVPACFLGLYSAESRALERRLSTSQLEMDAAEKVECGLQAKFAELSRLVS